MKRTLIIALALALALGTTGIAETAEPVPTEVEAAADVSTEEAGDQAQVAAEETDSKTSEASVTLEDALKALREARKEAKLNELKAELDKYVAAGKLTQEQADLILKQFSEKKDQRHGQKRNRRGGQQDGRQQNGKQGSQQMPDNQMPSNQMPQQDGQQMPGNRMPQQGGQQMPQQGGQQMPGNQMPQQGGNQMPGNQMPQQGGNQIPDAFSGATPQMGNQQMPGKHR